VFFYNGYNKTRDPNSFLDLLRLTFAPYLIWCIIYDKNKLQERKKEGLIISMKTFIISTIMIYALQAAICCICNMMNDVQFPRTFKEAIKLTFLPYVIWKHIKK